MNYLSAAPIVCLGLGVLSASASGGTSSSGPFEAYVVDDDDMLYGLDLMSGTTTAIGQINEPYVYDLMLSDSGRLYGQRDSGTDWLFEIDTATGMVTNSTTPDTYFDGDFLGEQMIGARDGNLFEIDTATGVSSNYLSMTFPGASLQLQNIAVANDGMAYGVAADSLVRTPNALVSIDLMTGVVTEIGDFDLGQHLGGFEFINGGLLAVGRDGRMFDVSVSDGSLNQVGAIGFNISGFAAVPAPSALGLLGLGAVAGVRRRR